MKLRLIKVSKLDRYCDEKLTYIIQKRGWFKWVDICSGTSERELTKLYEALLKREKLTIVNELRKGNV